jgi:hypothetical protein
MHWLAVLSDFFPTIVHMRNHFAHVDQHPAMRAVAKMVQFGLLPLRE